MNCEMAQRIIALAALSPAHTRPAASPHREPFTREPFAREEGPAAASESPDAALLETEALARFEADLFDLSGVEAGAPVENAPADASPLHAAVPLDYPLDPSAFGEPEVPEDERRALEEHLAGCRECQAEMAATAAFYRALSLTRQPEPTPSLLARARMRLDATLDTHAHQSAFAHLLQQLSFSAGRLRASPGLASGLLLLGLSIGGYAGYHAGHAQHHHEQGVLALESSPVIVHVKSITRDPGSEQVEVHYDRLEPDTFTGSLDDPAVRQFLIFAMLHEDDPSVRGNSVGLIAGECRQGHECNGATIRGALLKSLHADRNPQVRLEALNGLEPYIAEDMEVRDAVVRAMMADPSATVRIEAIRLLTPVEVDSTVRQALHSVAARDGDPLIRNASQQLLKDIPQMQ